MKVMSFSSIPAIPKREMVLLRLGYKKNTTQLNEIQNNFLEESMKDALALCRPEGIMARLAITERTDEYVKLETGDVLLSKSLSKLLEHSDEVVLMSSTVGREIVDKIHAEVNQGDASRGIIMDSVASQTADAGVAWIMDFVAKMIRREGKQVTKHRYSPGYGDLPLSNQRILFDILELQKLGLQLTEKYMLVPEKSVIAIAGIERVGSYEQG